MWIPQVLFCWNEDLLILVIMGWKLFRWLKRSVMSPLLFIDDLGHVLFVCYNHTADMVWPFLSTVWRINANEAEGPICCLVSQMLPIGWCCVYWQAWMDWSASPSSDSLFKKKTKKKHFSGLNGYTSEARFQHCDEKQITISKLWLNFRLVNHNFEISQFKIVIFFSITIVAMDF